MVGFVFPLKEDEIPATKGFPFINKNRDRLVSFDFEESSIDLGISALPRFVVNGLVYEPLSQYFELTSDNKVNRIIMISPTRVEKDIEEAVDEEDS